jgi:hypothetical protein
MIGFKHRLDGMSCSSAESRALKLFSDPYFQKQNHPRQLQRLVVQSLDFVGANIIY